MKKTSINKQSLINIIISYFGLFIGLFNTIFRTNVLTPSEIGLISILFSIAGIFQYFTVFGITNSLIKFYPEYRDEKNKKTGFLIFIIITPVFLFLLVSVIFLLNYELIIEKYDNILIKKYFLYVILILLINTLTEIFRQFLRIYYKTNYSTFVKDFLFKIFHLLLLLTVLFFNMKFVHYFHILLSFYFLMLVLFILKTLKLMDLYKPDFSFLNKKFLKKFVSYSSFRFLTSISGGLINKIDKLMISFFGSLANVGVYSISLSIGNILGIVGRSVLKVAHPQISDDLNKNNYKKIESTYKSTAKFEFFIGIFLFIYFTLFAKDFLTILGKEYSKGYLVLIVMALGQLINLMAGMCGGIISYSKYYKFAFYVRIIILLINAALNYFLIQELGILGAAIATSFSLAIFNIVKIIFVYRKFDMLPFTKFNLKSFFAALIAFTGAFLVKSLYFEINLFWIIIYFILSFILYIIGFILVGEKAKMLEIYKYFKKQLYNLKRDKK